MSRASGIAALLAAFTAGISMAIVVADSTGSGSTNGVRIETATDPSSQDAVDSPNPTWIDTNLDGETSVLTNRISGDPAIDVGTVTPPGAADPGRGSELEPPPPAEPEPAPTGPGGQEDGAGPATTGPDSNDTAATGPTPASSDAGQFEPMRNNDQAFGRYADLPATQIRLDQLTEPTPKADNGSNGEGQFRMACNYSHFSYDDPIVFPGQPGKSHFHMFFGNTRTDAFSTTESLVNSGGGSCNGFELNRSGYWTPALLDGKGNAVVPDRIILYYKTKRTSEVQGMPQGLKMVAGNVSDESFEVSQRLGWSCGKSGTSYNKSNQIPTNCGDDPINAYVQFPPCWDGKNLDSADHQTHVAFVPDSQACPDSHPVRLPQITILLYFPPGDSSGWYLSSDRSDGASTAPGATLHADWFGGWNDSAMDLWIDGCMRPARNCSFGQTGTPRMFAPLNDLQQYEGDNFIPIPT